MEFGDFTKGSCDFVVGFQEVVRSFEVKQIFLCDTVTRVCAACAFNIETFSRITEELQLLGLDCECSRDQEDAGASGAGGAGAVCF